MHSVVYRSICLIVACVCTVVVYILNRLTVVTRSLVNFRLACWYCVVRLIVICVLPVVAPYVYVSVGSVLRIMLNRLYI